MSAEFRPWVVELDNVLMVVLFFLRCVLYGCWFSEVVKKSSKLDGISSLIWSYTKRQLLKVKISFIFISFEFLNKRFTGSFFHLKLRIRIVFSWIFFKIFFYCLVPILSPNLNSTSENWIKNCKINSSWKVWFYIVS